jgi:AcrR family transcriptional regulator
MSEDRSVVAESGTRARTRRAILDAAASVLSTDPAASLGDVAAAAGVGRTTVHRYFPERSDLLAAVGADILDQIAAATERARLEDGPAPKALERLCQEYFELGDRLTLLFDVPQLINGPEWEQETPADRALHRAIERGQAEGTLDAGADAEWIQNVMWALLYSAWHRTRSTGTPKHTALTLCLHTLRKAIAP